MYENDKISHNKLKLPKIISYTYYQKKSSPILLNGLIILLLLITSLPAQTSQVAAQQPTGNTVFLPLVFQNSPGICPEDPDQWLCLLNYYRVIAGLNPVISNANYHYGLSLHMKYMLLNPSSDMHIEDPNNPGYTPEGADAGGQSNMIKLIGGTNLSVKDSIDLWMFTEKHRYHMLHPDLLQSGFNLNCDNLNCFSGLNILQGLSLQNVKRAVVYPGHNQVNVPANAYPISMGFYPSNLITGITVSKAILYNSSNNTVPGSITVMNDYFKQVIFKPNSSLIPNHQYRMEMSVTAGGQTFSDVWYFTTGP